MSNEKRATAENAVHAEKATQRGAGTRAYTSTLRSRQAAETRQRILAAAADRFSDVGFAGASLSDIAALAGVSVETVKLSGPKRDLLLAAFEQSFAGREGTDSLAEHEPILELTQTHDSDAYLAGVIHFVAEGNKRSNRLWAALLGAAAADTVLGQALAEMQQRRRADFHSLVHELTQRGILSAELDNDELADALSFLLSPEGYSQLVVEAGWDQGRYEQWLLRSIRLMGHM